MGRMPAFFMLENEVFSPIAASAQTIKNLLIFLVTATAAAGMEKMLATVAIAKKPKINHGKILVSLKFALIPSPDSAFANASLRLMFSWISANTTTVGMIASVRVSFTMVAKSPAASEKAYPVATTEEVSLTAVPAQSPNASSLMPMARPMMGNSTIIAMSNRKVALIA